VIANGEVWLVDVGPGAWESVDLANLPTAALRGVLLTHFHSDHIGDLGEAITQSWIAGRAAPLEVVGPTGVGGIVSGLAQVYAADIDYRVAHHGESALPRAAAGALAREFALPSDGEASVVLDRDGLKITMFAVDHRPVTPAVGYRVDWRGRSIVFSGDTKRSANLLRFTKGADILVHEGLDAEMVHRVSETAARMGRPRVARLANDILSYHTAPIEAAEIARAAGVATLVFSHVVPPPSNAWIRRHFLAGVSDVFTGEVVLGEDGQRFALAPRR
jgi:ribonuclease Z